MRKIQPVKRPQEIYFKYSSQNPNIKDWRNIQYVKTNKVDEGRCYTYGFFSVLSGSCYWQKFLTGSSNIILEDAVASHGDNFLKM